MLRTCSGPASARNSIDTTTSVPGQARQAAAVTVPVLFLNQWDDELMTREAALALWDALGSEEKTMHINPGGHVDMPGFEYRASEEFFARHLLAATPEPAQA